MVQGHARLHDVAGSRTLSMSLLRPALSGVVDRAGNSGPRVWKAGAGLTCGRRPLADCKGIERHPTIEVRCGGCMWIVNGIVAGIVLAMFLSMLSSPPPRTRE